MKMGIIEDKTKQTPLTVEGLLLCLNNGHCMTVAGFNGSCERVVRFDELVAALNHLKSK